jgi:hypothetical protein
MSFKQKRWQRLFLVCLGLFVGSAFCMKWMEGDLLMNGQKFTVIGLEISYPREKLMAILSGLDSHVKTILRYHLSFDFVFMAGVYPGIAALCMMARQKVSGGWIKNILILFAILQIAAWGCDIAENSYLFKWMNSPVVGSAEFGFYHIVVSAKWIIALAGALLSIPIVLWPKKSSSVA